MKRITNNILNKVLLDEEELPKQQKIPHNKKSAAIYKRVQKDTEL